MVHSMEMILESVEQRREQQENQLASHALEQAAMVKRQKEKESKRRIAAMKRRLTKGHLFYKHGRNNKAERRFVYVNERLTTIAWRKPATKYTASTKPNKIFPVSDVIGVVPNLVEKGAKPVQSKHFCFTLRLTSRTIQLECDNERNRDAWLEGKKRRCVCCVVLCLLGLLGLLGFCFYFHFYFHFYVTIVDDIH